MSVVRVMSSIRSRLDSNYSIANNSTSVDHAVSVHNDGNDDNDDSS